MNFDTLFALLLHITIWDIIKIFLEISLLIYIFFSVVVIRQVDLMGHALGVSLTPVLRFLAAIHFFATVGIFVLALLIL